MKKTFCLVAVAAIALGLAGFVTAQKRGGGKRSAPATIRETTSTTLAAAPAPASAPHWFAPWLLTYPAKSRTSLVTRRRRIVG